MKLFSLSISKSTWSNVDSIFFCWRSFSTLIKWSSCLRCSLILSVKYFFRFSNSFKYSSSLSFPLLLLRLCDYPVFIVAVVVNDDDDDDDAGIVTGGETIWEVVSSFKGDNDDDVVGNGIVDSIAAAANGIVDSVVVVVVAANGIIDSVDDDIDDSIASAAAAANGIVDSVDIVVVAANGVVDSVNDDIDDDNAIDVASSTYRCSCHSTCKGKLSSFTSIILSIGRAFALDLDLLGRWSLIISAIYLLSMSPNVSILDSISFWISIENGG